MQVSDATLHMVIGTPKSRSREHGNLTVWACVQEALDVTFAHPSTPELGFSGYSMGFPAPPAGGPRDATNTGTAIGQHAPTYRPSHQVTCHLS